MAVIFGRISAISRSTLTLRLTVERGADAVHYRAGLLTTVPAPDAIGVSASLMTYRVYDTMSYFG